MNYYILNESTESKIIGPIFPQCQEFLKGYDNSFENKNSFFHFAHFKGLEVDFLPDCSSFLLKEKVRLTDLMSCYLGPGNDKLVSDSLYQVIKNFNCSDVQVFDCTLNKKLEIFSNYKWIHFVYNLEKYVDFSKSTYHHPDKELKKKSRDICNFDDYVKFDRELDTFALLTAKKTVINHKPLDFFTIGQINQKCYVSKKLKSEIEHLSGVDFKEANDILFL